MATVDLIPMNGFDLGTGKPVRLPMWQIMYIDDIDSRYAGIARKHGNMELRPGFSEEEQEEIVTKVSAHLKRDDIKVTPLPPRPNLEQVDDVRVSLGDEPQDDTDTETDTEE